MVKSSEPSKSKFGDRLAFVRHALQMAIAAAPLARTAVASNRQKLGLANAAQTQRHWGEPAATEKLSRRNP